MVRPGDYSTSNSIIIIGPMFFTMKGIFQLKPSLPKYTTIWDVGQLLGYLESLPLSAELSLKDLSLKTATLLSILTGQRCQTLHKIGISFIQTHTDVTYILFPEPLKTTRPGYHQAPLQLLASASFVISKTTMREQLR